MSQFKSTIPASADEAADRVMTLVRAARSQTLQTMSDDVFKQLWPSVAYLYPGLHPDSAADHGTEIRTVPSEEHQVLLRFPELGAPYYTQSGWPIALEPVIEEAWHRFENNLLADDEMYCNVAQLASLGISL